MLRRSSVGAIRLGRGHAWKPRSCCCGISWTCRAGAFRRSRNWRQLTDFCSCSSTACFHRRWTWWRLRNLRRSSGGIGPASAC